MLGPVVDLASGVISGLTATLAGDRIQANWSSNATGTPATFFTVVGCYHTLLLGTNLPLHRVRQAGFDDCVAIDCAGFADGECWTAWSAGELRRLRNGVGRPGHGCFGFGDG